MTRFLVAFFIFVFSLLSSVASATDTQIINVVPKRGDTVIGLCLGVYRQAGGTLSCGDFVREWARINGHDPNHIFAGVAYQMPAPREGVGVASEKVSRENVSLRDQMEDLKRRLGEAEAVANKVTGELAEARRVLAQNASEIARLRSLSLEREKSGLENALPAPSQVPARFQWGKLISFLLFLLFLGVTIACILLRRKPNSSGSQEDADRIELLQREVHEKTKNEEKLADSNRLLSSCAKEAVRENEVLKAELAECERAKEGLATKVVDGALGALIVERTSARKELELPEESRRELLGDVLGALYVNLLSDRREAFSSVASHLFPDRHASFEYDGQVIGLPLARVEVVMDGKVPTVTEYVFVDGKEHNLSKLGACLRRSPELREKLGLGEFKPTPPEDRPRGDVEDVHPSTPEEVEGVVGSDLLEVSQAPLVAGEDEVAAEAPSAPTPQMAREEYKRRVSSFREAQGLDEVRIRRRTNHGIIYQWFQRRFGTFRANQVN